MDELVKLERMLEKLAQQYEKNPKAVLTNARIMKKAIALLAQAEKFEELSYARG